MAERQQLAEGPRRRGNPLALNETVQKLPTKSQPTRSVTRITRRYSARHNAPQFVPSPACKKLSTIKRAWDTIGRSMKPAPGTLN